MENFKETIKRIAKEGYQTRGDLLILIEDYLRKKGLEKFFPKIKEKMAEYGYPLDSKEINIMGWYPLAMEIALIFSLVDVLKWTEKEIKILGKDFTRLSFIEKILTKYLISPQVTFKASQLIWRKHMDKGELEGVELNEKEKYAIFRLKDFHIHPLYCQFLSGMLETFGDYVTGSKENICQETKCTFKGDSYHEFLIKWK